MSPRNSRHNNLSMEEKGKVVTIEIDEEEEDVEEDIQPLRPVTKFLAYFPPRKWKTKISKDLDAMKSTL